jgi:hypothetical protein
MQVRLMKLRFGQLAAGAVEHRRRSVDRYNGMSALGQVLGVPPGAAGGVYRDADG